MRFAAVIFINLLFALAAAAQTPHTDTPQTGEGIGAFLLRNGYNPQRYKAKFIELNQSRLGKDNTLLLGVRYTLPTKNDDTAYEPLLGKKNENVKIVNRDLEGATYYLVSGHGGPDPGAMGQYNQSTLCEDEYAYDIVLRLAKVLLSRGATVHIIIQDPNDGIREDAILQSSKDETCMGEEIPLNQTLRLRQRAEAINKLYENEKSGYTRAIFVHIDSRSRKKQIDIFFYHHKDSPRGKALAETMRKRFEQKYKQHQPQRGFDGTVSARSLQVLNESNPVGVFLELGNIQNYRDQLRFVRPDNRQAIANWMAEGLADEYKTIKR